MFLEKGVLKICSKFTGERPSRSAISIKLQSKFNEITLRHEYSPVNLLHIFITPFLKNISGWLLLKSDTYIFDDILQFHKICSILQNASKLWLKCLKSNKINLLNINLTKATRRLSWIQLIPLFSFWLWRIKTLGQYKHCLW